MDRRFMILKKMDPRGRSAPNPWQYTMYIAIIFKDLLLWNRLANKNQTSCGAFLGRENENLYKWSRSHDQDGHHGYK